MKSRGKYFLWFICIVITGLSTQTYCQEFSSDKDILREIVIPAPSLSNNIFSIPAEQKISVCVPPFYSITEIRYPVLYFLTDYSEEPFVYTGGMFQSLKIQTSLKDMVTNKTINPMIIVIISGNNFLGSGFYVNSATGGNWEDFIINDVVKYIDNKFRTITESKSRGIAGITAGGFGALNIAMKHPDVFGSVYALSPNLFDKNGLANSQMFSENLRIEKFLRCEKEASELAKDQAHTKFTNFCDNSSDEDFLYLLAYGEAFAPNTQKNAPYIDFPYAKSSAKANLNKDIWKKWEDGFGNWDEKVKSFKDNFLKLKGIYIECGLKEDVKWIIDGCKYLNKLFTAENIPIKFVTFEGKHQDALRERIEKFMLTYFSTIFSSN